MKQLIILSVFFISATCLSQEVIPKSEKRIVFSLSSGIVSVPNIGFDQSHWNKNLPGFLNPDTMSEYTHSEFSNIGRNSSGFTQLKIDITYANRFLATKKITPSFGVAVGFGGGVRGGDYFGKNNTVTADTLVSQQTGTQYYVDKNTSEVYTRNYQTSDFSFGITNHYSTDVSKLLSFMTGFEVLYAISIDPICYGNSSKSVDYVMRYNGSSDYNSSSTFLQGYPNESEFSEIQRSKGPLCQSVYFKIPFDLSIRLGRKNNFLSRSRIGIEDSPSIALSFVDGIQNTSFSNWIGINYKYTF